MNRNAKIQRKTRETEIDIFLNLDSSEKVEISTGIPFFDHMLELFSVHGDFGLLLDAKGDIEVDFHHTVEDTGIALGMAFKKALGDLRGIRRYGDFSIPMDETLAKVTLDISNRPFLAYNLPEVIRAKGAFSAYLAREFFIAFSQHAGITLHINVLYGENEHHIIEACFKGLGRALSSAVEIVSNKIPSTKGVL
ncbi:MAG: imidazoleglycerol-phosphate dehydratase [Deltaproteobacteria bacterium]|nr:MAG: imidazoleglycerol-phosphate dehydratase [Deltaproteobacteria bacterium]